LQGFCGNFVPLFVTIGVERDSRDMGQFSDGSFSVVFVGKSVDFVVLWSATIEKIAILVRLSNLSGEF
jgi:hypothetical protein